MGFPRQEYWSDLPFPSPGIFPTQGSNHGFSCVSWIVGQLFTPEPPGKPDLSLYFRLKYFFEAKKKQEGTFPWDDLSAYSPFKSYFLITLWNIWAEKYQILMMAQWPVWLRIQAQIQMKISYFFRILIFSANLICLAGINCLSLSSTHDIFYTRYLLIFKINFMFHIKYSLIVVGHL